MTAIAALDIDGRVSALNADAERLFGVSASDALGHRYSEVFGTSVADRIIGLFLRVVRSGKTGEMYTIRATLPDGRLATLEATAGPVRDAAGKLLGVLFVAEDTGREQRLFTALKSYIGDKLAEAVDARPSFVGTAGVRKTISVLHADVRGYSTLAEAMEPEDVLGLLQRYHGAAVSALQAAGATIDRFIGDAILAFWNAPEPQSNHAALALQGALALQHAVRETGHDLAYGVGIHTGEAVVGNLGTAAYMNYTAIGDTVNVAARLQSAAAAGAVVCSVAALQQAGSLPVRAEHLGEVSVKGRVQPVDAYRLELAP